MGQERRQPAAATAERQFQKVILRLVKGGPERRAIEAGQIDAVIDPASGSAILLPRAQHTLVERNAMFRSLVGLTSDWFWEQDEQCRFVSHQGATAESYEFGGADIIGKSLWDLSIDNMSESDWQAHRQQLAWRATFRDLELRHLSPAGEVRYLSISGEPILNERHEFTGYRGITRDITPRMQWEARLQEPNRFARATLDALNLQVAVLDPAGVVRLANKAWNAFAGTHSGIGAGVSERYSYLAACDHATGKDHADGAAIAAGIRQVIAGQRELFRYSHACHSPVGRRWFVLSVTGIVGGTAARAVVTREDITERERGELLLALEQGPRKTRAIRRAVNGASRAKPGAGGASSSGRARRPKGSPSP